MPIEFRCPSCRTDLRAPDSKRATEAWCPKCKAELRVPRFEGFWAQCRRAQRLSKGRGVPWVVKGLAFVSLWGLAFIGPGGAVGAIALAAGRSDWFGEPRAALALQLPVWVLAPLVGVRVAIPPMAGKRWAVWPAAAWLVLGWGAFMTATFGLKTWEGNLYLDRCALAFFGVWPGLLVLFVACRLSGADVREYCRY